MAKYVLECNCGSRDFDYDGNSFWCTDCTNELPEKDAGLHLVEEE